MLKYMYACVRVCVCLYVGYRHSCTLDSLQSSDGTSLTNEIDLIERENDEMSMGLLQNLPAAFCFWKHN